MPSPLPTARLRRQRRRSVGSVSCALLLSALGVAHSQDTPPQAGSPAPSNLPDAPGAPAALLGSVIDTNGKPLAGALVTVAPATGIAPAPILTAEDGHFAFVQLPQGELTLTVALAGFATRTVVDTLHAGSNGTLAPVVLHLAASVSVDAVDAHELAARQIRIEEQQKLIGILPNFFVSYEWYTPALSPGQKFHLAFRNAIDPGSFFATGIASGIQQATNSFPGYGQGVAGFGRRYGANYGNLVSGTFLGGAILPTLFHQDPRYFWKGTGTVRSRVLYAISRPIIQRGDNGKWQPAYSSVLGDLSAGALSNLYYAPEDRQGARLTFINGFIGIGGDAVNDLFQEFLLKRFTPKAKNLPPTAP